MYFLFFKRYKKRPKKDWRRIDLSSVIFSLILAYLFVLGISLVANSAEIGRIQTPNLSPNVKSFLDTIASAEGTARPGGYRIQFGGTKFKSYDKHPDNCIAFQYGGRHTCSTAAGRYQFLTTTWDELAWQLNLSDFSPHSQDLAAVQLIRDQGALEDIENGHFETAIYKVASVWASLPTSAGGGSYYGQPHVGIGKLRQVYLASRSLYSSETQSRPLDLYVAPLPGCSVALFGNCIPAQPSPSPPSCENALFGKCE